jgi:hypothetical protein
MYTRNRLVWSLALATIIALGVACGGGAEEPAENTADANESAAVSETSPAPEPMPEAEQPAAPTEPQLEGAIVEIEEAHEMAWTTAASREVPGEYYWVVELRNDTTQTLDITVTFEFLDENGGEVKTDRSTERISPAASGTFRVEGQMNRDDSRSVDGYTYTWAWNIVTS